MLRVKFFSYFSTKRIYNFKKSRLRVAVNNNLHEGYRTPEEEIWRNEEIDQFLS